MCPQPGGIPSELTTAFPDANLPLRAGEVDAVDSRIRLLRHRLSPFSWRYQHTNGPPQRRATTSGVSAEHCTPVPRRPSEGRRTEQVPRRPAIRYSWFGSNHELD